MACSADFGPLVFGAQRPAAAQEAEHPNADALMSPARTSAEFEQLFLPHLDAAYNLARLLMRNPHDAEDVVQESYLKALRAFSSFVEKPAARGFLRLCGTRRSPGCEITARGLTGSNITRNFTRAAGLLLRLNRLGMNTHGPWNGACSSFHPIFGKPSCCAKWKNYLIRKSRKLRECLEEQ